MQGRALNISGSVSGAHLRHVKLLLAGASIIALAGPVAAPFEFGAAAADPGYGRLLYWDGDDSENWDNGQIDGGDGRWRTGGRAFTNETGTENAAIGSVPGFAVFGGTAGRVVLDTGTGQVQSTGMQFATNGYIVTGDMLDLVAGDAIIRVGDGTAAGANYVATITNKLDGAGRLIKTDLGTLILTGESTYWGGTEVRQGTLQIGDGGMGGAIVGDVLNNGVMAFHRSDESFFEGTISGSGVVRIIGGDFTFTADNTYLGRTIIENAAILRLGKGDATGSVVGNIINNGALMFNRSNDFAYNGVISGTGATHFLNGGFTLTGNNQYRGGTVIANEAIVSLGNGGETGSIRGNVFNDGSLIFNRSNDLTLDGVISGDGRLRQSGPGKTELTGYSTTFAGMTTVENGTLAVNNTLGGTMDVWETGRLQGIGTVGDTTVAGTIAPGNSIGTLNVAGNITFHAGSIYEVEIDAEGQSDQILATGSAAINGGAVNVLAGTGNYSPATTYTILTADGGLTGTFTEGVTSDLAFLNPSLSYDANNVYLTMTRNSVEFQNVGETRNQIAAGRGVESLGSGNAIYDRVLNLSVGQARGAFDHLSGEIHSSARAAMLEDSRFLRNAVNDRLRSAFERAGASTTYENGKPLTAPTPPDRLAVWGQGFGSWGHMDGDGNAARLQRSTGGFFVGADAPVSDTWRFGAVAGYSNTSLDADDRDSNGTSDNYHISLYGGTNWGNLTLRSGASYSWHDVSTKRNVSFSGFSDHLKESYSAGTSQVFGELGYGIAAGAVRFEPFANLAYVNVHTNGFTEEGGAAALTGHGTNSDATFATLGLRASTTFDLGGGTVTARGMAGWRHAFGDVTPETTMRFAGGGDAFSISGASLSRNAALIEAGLDYALTANATLGLTYDGQFSSDTSDQSVKANFSLKF